MTNSKPQDTTQTNTQSYGLLRLRGDQATVLDFSPEKATDQGATSAAMSYSRRRDAATTHVTAGGPTLRRTAAPQTHATQHGRQRQRSRYRPTASLQLPADQRPDTVDNVGGLVPPDGLDSAFPADQRPDTVDNVGGFVPPDELASALPADSRRQYLPHLSTSSTTEQTYRSTDPQSARRFRTASILNCKFPSIRTADNSKRAYRTHSLHT